jgi:hypothetical protein
VHRLIRIMAACAPFLRDSRAEFEVTSQHEAHWAVFPLSRLRPEQVAGALTQACSLKTLDAHTHIAFQLLQFAQVNDFVERYGDMGEDEFEDRGGTIPQRLLLMNGDLVNERIGDNPLTSAATHVSMFAESDEQAVETVYLSVLTRRPSQRELDHFLKRFELSEDGGKREVVEDLYWVLLNSTEFSWNH